MLLNKPKLGSNTLANNKPTIVKDSITGIKLLNLKTFHPFKRLSIAIANSNPKITVNAVTSVENIKLFPKEFQKLLSLMSLLKLSKPINIGSASPSYLKKLR